MGNTQSDTNEHDDEKATLTGTIIGYVIGGLAIIMIIIVFFKYNGAEVVKGGIKGVSAAMPTGQGVTGGMKPGQWPWHIITPVLLIIFMALYSTLYFYWTYTRGQFRSRPDSIARLIGIRSGKISGAIGSLTPVHDSVTKQLVSKPRPVPYSLIGSEDRKLAMVNYRPLTVRLTGYLGGINGPLDGVFDMGVGIVHSLRLGARAFVFDIDYFDAKPCEPVVMFRDDMGIMRSLHGGSIKEGMIAIAANAFTGDVPNYDPVLAIIYIRRLPPGTTQKSKFFQNIAMALDPISEYHLGQTQDGNFHNCISESALFTNPITHYQKKIIVLVNYDTSQLPSHGNPKNSLHWWTNARMYLDPNGKSTALGKVTTTAPTSPPAYVHVGHIDHLMNVGAGQPTTDFQITALNTFKIALGSPEYPFTVAELSKLMNVLGVQCIPLDVISLGTQKTHKDTLDWKSIYANSTPSRLNQLTNPQNIKDPLSFWIYGGWSRKMLQGESADGFQDYKKYTEGFDDKPAKEAPAPVPQAQPIPGFVIPAPQAPNKPPPTMNSSGGKVSIG